MSRQGNRNMKSFYAILALIAVAGVAAIAFLATGSGGSSVITLDPNITPGEAQAYAVGSPDAKLDVYEYADFECPGCGHFAIVTEPDVRKRLVETGLIRFHFVDFPLSMHPNALSAHVAAACADNQDKFWPMHDMIFQGQNEWNTQATRDPKKFLQQYAREIGLDMQEWESCYDNRETLSRVLANQQQGLAIGVPSTPTFRIGNRLFSEVASYDKLKVYIDSALADTALAAGRTSQNK